jgi:hypothetical protein
MSDQLAAGYVGLGVTTFREAMAEAGIDRWLDGRAGRTAPSAPQANPWHA